MNMMQGGEAHRKERDFTFSGSFGSAEMCFGEVSSISILFWSSVMPDLCMMHSRICKTFQQI